MWEVDEYYRIKVVPIWEDYNVGSIQGLYD